MLAVKSKGNNEEILNAWSFVELDTPVLYIKGNFFLPLSPNCWHPKID